METNEPYDTYYSYIERSVHLSSGPRHLYIQHIQYNTLAVSTSLIIYVCELYNCIIVCFNIYPRRSREGRRQENEEEKIKTTHDLRKKERRNQEK